MFNILKKLTLPIMAPIIAMGMMLGMAGNAKAEIIFDTLDTTKGGVGGDADGSAWVMGNFAGSNFAYGVTFSPISDFTLTRISPLMRDLFNDSGDEMYTLSLYEDFGGDIDTSTFLHSVTKTVTNTTLEYVAFDFSGFNLNLMAGTTYWIVLGASNDEGRWGRSTKTSNWQFSSDGGGEFDDNTALTPILRIEDNRVNAPATLSLLSITLMSMAAIAYRRRKA